MKKLLFAIVCILFFLNTSGQEDKTIVGYYPNWQWYDRANLVNPETIQYEKYSIINYAFFSPQSDGSISLTDPWADENLLLGPMIWWPDPHNDSTRSLPYLAHQEGVKVLPSIGGWTLSYNFSSIAFGAFAAFWNKTISEEENKNRPRTNMTLKTAFHLQYYWKKIKKGCNAGSTLFPVQDENKEMRRNF